MKGLAGNTPLHIALLMHSTLPRGGVVHALALGDALADAGHHVRLLAPTLPGETLFRAPRSPRCRFVAIPATRVDGDLAALVRQRIKDWRHYFATSPEALDADIVHAQDPISANALADLVACQRLPGFVRTVHHLDSFVDPQLAAWQRRGYRAAKHVCCVSERWRDTLLKDEGIDAAVVCNGVDRRRFSPEPDEDDVALKALHAVRHAGPDRDRPGVSRLPIFLSVGGVEARKNTMNALAAYILWRQGDGDRAGAGAAQTHRHRAQWWIAGGASLLDHRDYGQRFLTMAAQAGLSVSSTCDAKADIILLGRIDDALMPALFRAADALLFPSLVEGFGLVVLEALSVGTPVVTSRIAPFTEYLPEAAVEWADPMVPHTIAAAMHRAVQHVSAVSAVAEEARAASAQRQQAGFAVAAAFSWAKSASQHIDLYRRWQRDLPADIVSHQEPHHA